MTSNALPRHSVGARWRYDGQQEFEITTTRRYNGHLTEVTLTPVTPAVVQPDGRYRGEVFDIGCMAPEDLDRDPLWEPV